MQVYGIRAGLTPTAMRDMTPRELQWAIEGVWTERSRHLEIAAQLACWVLTPFGRKPLQVKDLIRRRGTKKRKKDDEE